MYTLYKLLTSPIHNIVNTDVRGATATQSIKNLFTIYDQIEYFAIIIFWPSSLF